jgi:ribosome-associated translation inhibitor RaiA
MKFHLVPHKLQLTEAIQNFTEEKLATLKEISADVQSADRLAVPGQDVHASQTGPNLYAAIDRVQSKLASAAEAKDALCSPPPKVTSNSRAAAFFGRAATWRTNYELKP